MQTEARKAAAATVSVTGFAAVAGLTVALEATTVAAGATVGVVEVAAVAAPAAAWLSAGKCKNTHACSSLVLCPHTRSCTGIQRKSQKTRTSNASSGWNRSQC